MPTTLVVTFPLGRYHATPWARHVNEGQVELPPSPWRLLRALYAAWKTRVPDLDEEIVHGLLSRLAEPPTYFVPPYSLGHTRHYYPDSTRRSGASGNTDRTLDAFASVSRGAELAVRWPWDLEVDHKTALSRLADSLPYLGRADSVCMARVDDGWSTDGGHTICGPVDIGESIHTDQRAVALLAPALPLDFEALTHRPVDVRAGQLLFPRSTRFVGYHAPGPERSTTSPLQRWKAAAIEAVSFEIVSLVRPSHGDGLHLTDRLRNAAVGRLCERRGQVLGFSRLAGRDADQERLTGHRHAHYMALPDTERRVGFVVAWAPGGFCDDEVAALAAVKELYGAQNAPGPGTVRIRMNGYGTTSSVLSAYVGSSRIWRSITPFASSRHQKGEWKDFVTSEINRELAFRHLPTATVDIIDEDWVHFVRYRPSKRFQAARPDRRSGPRGVFVQLTFESAQSGPIALGHLAHFGLGLFQPILRQDAES